MPDFQLEQKWGAGVAGIDEVGRGPWAGPVLACAVILDQSSLPEDLLEGLDDSKKLTAKERDIIFEPLTKSVDHSIGIASVEEVDALNILQASLLAMRRAVAALPTKPRAALVDGNRDPDLGIPTELVVKGDSRSLSIAAASVIAKVTRDRMMADLAREFPGYGWEKNAGYGTAQHQSGIKEFGITPHHRRSFKPIAKILEENPNHIWGICK